MKKIFFGFLIAIPLFIPSAVSAQTEPTRFWQIQSIDTMKYSRDLAREMLNKPEFDTTIEQQISQIAKTGATHVAIATPYDEEFVPFLKRWVESARKHGLKVWFRGNFSGWEGWFNYPTISREEHLSKTRSFIETNGNLFRDGDIFVTCPECENGGAGDPRRTGDVVGFRQFMIDSHTIASSKFNDLGIKVSTNYFSMNGDVARLTMDRETTSQLEGVVVIDHYVKTPAQLATDIQDFVSRSGGKVILGEFGAPIPDIHGSLTPEQQAEWVDEALQLVSKNPSVIGVNYWLSYGGSTSLWNGDGSEKKAVSILKKWYTPREIMITVTNEIREPVTNASVIFLDKKYVADRGGRIRFPATNNDIQLTLSAPDYIDREIVIPTSTNLVSLLMVPTNPDTWFKLKSFLFHTFIRLGIVK